MKLGRYMLQVTYVRTDGRTDVRTDGQTENLPILQDIVQDILQDIAAAPLQPNFNPKTV